ncbi:MAG TPA: alpha/beta hydrolase, partial [Polyangiales bacterium]|nr:alpha/beta hydrolase [Polyangiales bacterium]
APTGPIKAAIQIAHGLGEHAARYDRVATALTRAGYAVYASDHRGHGHTAVRPDDYGHFADRDGWNRVVEDLYAVTLHIASERPGSPRVIFGHSFGSFVVQDYVSRYGNALSGMVLSGTNSGDSANVMFSRLGAYLERVRIGPRNKSALIFNQSIGQFNKRFAPNRTTADWLSRDPVEVDKYVADPLCGFDLTTQGWIDLMGGLLGNNASSLRARVPKNLPVYLFAGELDPVGREGKGPRELYEAYQRAGLSRVRLKLYEGARHEMLNELERDQVTADLIGWLDSEIVTQPPAVSSATEHA